MCVSVSRWALCGLYDLICLNCAGLCHLNGAQTACRSDLEAALVPMRFKLSSACAEGVERAERGAQTLV